MPTSKMFSFGSRGQSKGGAQEDAAKSSASDTSSQASAAESGRSGSVDVEVGRMRYIVQSDTLHYRKWRQWGDIIEDKPAARSGEIVKIVRISGLGGISWAQCEDTTFLPIEQNRQLFMVRE